MGRFLLIVAIGGLALAGCDSQKSSSTGKSNNSRAAGDSDAGATASGGAGNAASQSFDDSGGPVMVDEIVLTAPTGWQRKQPSSSFVAAEFDLPHAEGDEADGRMTVSTAGGTVEANVDRWKAQFNPLQEEKPPETVEVAGMGVTVVDFSGDFNDSRGPFAPAVKRPGYRMIAAIVPAEGRLHFIKATGPQKTMAAHADEIQKFIRSVKKAQ